MYSLHSFRLLYDSGCPHLINFEVLDRLRGFGKAPISWKFAISSNRTNILAFVLPAQSSLGFVFKIICCVHNWVLWSDGGISLKWSHSANLTLLWFILHGLKCIPILDGTYAVYTVRSENGVWNIDHHFNKIFPRLAVFRIVNCYWDMIVLHWFNTKGRN